MKEMLGNLVFSHRKAVVILFLVLTVFMAWQASHLKIDAGFAKLLPLKHPYMQTFVEYRDAYGGANKVVIAIRAKDGDMFTPEFFQVLAEITDEELRERTAALVAEVDETGAPTVFVGNPDQGSAVAVTPVGITPSTAAASPMAAPLTAQEQAAGGLRAPPRSFALPMEIEHDFGATNGDATIFRFLPLWSVPLSESWRLINLELVTLADVPGGVPGGVNKNLDSLGCLLTWASNQGYRDGNPVAGLKMRRPASAGTDRQPLDYGVVGFRSITDNCDLVRGHAQHASDT